LAIVKEAMATLDILHLSPRWITDLSGGERQRTLIARASRVILLDEPTAFLDLHHQVEMCSMLRRLREVHGLTVVVVSHDLNLVSQHCDRILLLANGRVSHVGLPEEVIQPQVLEAVYRCRILVDRHPASGLPRVTLPAPIRHAGLT
jgi:iron complex transport system ATP-binding protein